MRFNSLGIWNVRASPNPKVWSMLIPSIRRPRKCISPLVGAMAPDTRLNSVVLPAPFGPMSPVIASGTISSEQWSTARTPPKSFTTSRTSRIGPGSVNLSLQYGLAPPARRSAVVPPLYQLTPAEP